MAEATDSGNAASSTAATTEPAVTQDSGKAESLPAAPAGGTETGKDGSAASSTAKAEPSSAVEAMKQAMTVMDAANAERTGAKPKEAGSPAQEASGKDGDAKPEGEGDGKGDAGDGKDDEGKGKPNPKTEARFVELTGKLKEAEPKVRNWDSMQTYINTSGWKNPQAFAQFLEFGKMANLEPHKAIPVLEKTLEALKRRVGEAGELPADIQKRLDDGLIDEAAAREIASLRGRSQFVEQQTEQQRQQDALDNQRDTEERRVHSIADSITKADKAWQSSDPDYQKLQPLVMDKVLVLLSQEGANVKTPEDAQKLFDKAVSEGKKQAAALRGPGREIRPMTNGGGGKGAVPDPKNAYEAVTQAYAGLRAGT
jgi:hypothetical protein